MHIEQVVGGVNGDTTLQAVQLVMRFNGQEQVQQARLRAWDAAGQNPILVADLDRAVPMGTAGARVLIASPDFGRATDPPVVPDFLMTNLIPPPYLAAGNLTFENDEQTFVVWRLSWGGVSFTGSTRGAETNNDDGEFGPPFPGPLPSDDVRALLYHGAVGGLSTSNADDFTLTEGTATFINNLGDVFTVTTPRPPDEGTGATNDSQTDGGSPATGDGEINGLPSDGSPPDGGSETDGSADAAGGVGDASTAGTWDDPSNPQPSDTGTDEECPDSAETGATTGATTGTAGTSRTPRFCGIGLIPVLPLVVVAWGPNFRRKAPAGTDGSRAYIG
jgi:hypothetical protein